MTLGDAERPLRRPFVINRVKLYRFDVNGPWRAFLTFRKSVLEHLTRIDQVRVVDSILRHQGIHP